MWQLVGHPEILDLIPTFGLVSNTWHNSPLSLPDRSPSSFPPSSLCGCIPLGGFHNISSLSCFIHNNKETPFLLSFACLWIAHRVGKLGLSLQLSFVCSLSPKTITMLCLILDLLSHFMRRLTQERYSCFPVSHSYTLEKCNTFTEWELYP